MYLNYSPEIVKLVIDERIEEALATRRGCRSGGGIRTRTVALARRLTGLRPTPSACTTCA
jgi:hypothetical protein